MNCRTKYLPSEGKWEIAGTSECRFTKTPTGDTRRCCTYYPYRRHTSLLQDFRLLLSLPYRRHTSLLPGSLEEGRPDRLGPAHGEDRAGWPGENIEEGKADVAPQQSWLAGASDICPPCSCLYHRPPPPLHLRPHGHHCHHHHHHHHHHRRSTSVLMATIVTITIITIIITFAGIALMCR